MTEPRRWSVELTADRLGRARDAVLAIRIAQLREHEERIRARTSFGTPSKLRRVVGMTLAFGGEAFCVAMVPVGFHLHRIGLAIAFTILSIAYGALAIATLFQVPLRARIQRFNARMAEKRLGQIYGPLLARAPYTAHYELHEDRVNASTAGAFPDRVDPLASYRSATRGEGVFYLRGRGPRRRDRIVYFEKPEDADALIARLIAAGVTIEGRTAEKEPFRWTVEMTAERLGRAQNAVSALQLADARARRERVRRIQTFGIPVPKRAHRAFKITAAVGAETLSISMIPVSLWLGSAWLTVMFGALTVLFGVVVLMNVLDDPSGGLNGFGDRLIERRIRRQYQPLVAKAPYRVEYEVYDDRVVARAPVLQSERTDFFSRYSSVTRAEGLFFLRHHRRRQDGILYFERTEDADALVARLAAAGVRLEAW